MATNSVEHGALFGVSGTPGLEDAATPGVVLIVLIGLVKIGVAAIEGCGKAADTAEGGIMAGW